jgi:hypothetical protein
MEWLDLLLAVTRCTWQDGNYKSQRRSETVRSFETDSFALIKASPGH